MCRLTHLAAAGFESKRLRLAPDTDTKAEHLADPTHQRVVVADARKDEPGRVLVATHEAALSAHVYGATPRLVPPTRDHLRRSQTRIKNLFAAGARTPEFCVVRHPAPAFFGDLPLRTRRGGGFLQPARIGVEEPGVHGDHVRPANSAYWAA
jgi:hypothetical protein